MRLSGKFIFYFLMKRLIHANKTLKAHIRLKHKVIYIHFMPPHAFSKDLRTNIKNKVP